MSLTEPRTLLERLVSEQPYTWQEIEERFAARARANGERVSVSWRQLQRIAAGETSRPRPAVARVLASLFDHSLDDLLGPPSRPLPDEAEVTDPMRRREFLASVAAASIGVAAPESLTQLMDGLVSEHPRRVGMSDVVAVESATDAYMGFDLARSGQVALPFARATLAWATALLDLEMAGPVRERLASAIALLADRVGWSVYDSGGRAGRLLTFALDHAARGADPDLRAHVMLDLSTVTTDSGHAGDGVDIIRAALGDERVSAAERANLHAVCARHCAAAGQRDSGLRHVRLAEEALEAGSSAGGPEWARRITYGPGHHDSALGLALFALGDSTRARTRLDAALARLDSGRTRTGLRCRIRLAALDLREGDRATGEERGHRVLADIGGVTSVRVKSDLAMLRRDAVEHGANDLVADIAAVATAS